MDVLNLQSELSQTKINFTDESCGRFFEELEECCFDDDEGVSFVSDAIFFSKKQCEKCCNFFYSKNNHFKKISGKKSVQKKTAHFQTVNFPQKILTRNPDRSN